MNPLASIPALEPPPGIMPDFNKPESLAAVAFIITSAIFLVLMMTAFTLRLYVKVSIKRKFGTDDGMCYSFKGGFCSLLKCAVACILATVKLPTENARACGND